MKSDFEINKFHQSLRCSVIGMGNFGFEALKVLSVEFGNKIKYALVDRQFSSECTDAHYTLFKLKDLIKEPDDALKVNRDIPLIFDQFLDFCRNSHVVILIAAFSGVIGPGAAPSLVDLLHRISAISILLSHNAIENVSRKDKLIAQLTSEKVSSKTFHIPLYDSAHLSKETFRKPPGYLEISCFLRMLEGEGEKPICFSDIFSLLKEPGLISLAACETSGANRAVLALNQLLMHPSIQISMQHSARCILYFHSNHLSLKEIHSIASSLSNNWNGDLEIAFGACTDREMDYHLRVCLLVATTK